MELNDFEIRTEIIAGREAMVALPEKGKENGKLLKEAYEKSNKIIKTIIKKGLTIIRTAWMITRKLLILF